MDPQIRSNKQIDGSFNIWTILKTTHQTKQRKKKLQISKIRDEQGGVTTYLYLTQTLENTMQCYTTSQNTWINF